MSFIVSARTPSGEIRFRRDSMIDALDKGLSLLSAGMDAVRISDPSGASRTPAEFSRALLDGRKPRRAATGLAA